MVTSCLVERFGLLITSAAVAAFGPGMLSWIIGGLYRASTDWLLERR